MSKNYEKIKRYYDKGIYKVEHLRKLVEKGGITAEEFFLISGQDY